MFLKIPLLKSLFFVIFGGCRWLSLVVGGCRWLSVVVGGCGGSCCSLWAPRGVSWGSSGRPWETFAVSGCGFGGTWGNLGVSWGPLGTSGDLLGDPLGHLGRPLPSLGVALGVPGATWGYNFILRNEIVALLYEILVILPRREALGPPISIGPGLQFHS